MNKINWKIRFKNPVFIAQLLLAIITPILAYAGLTVQDMVTWQALGELLLNAISNPYIIGLVAVSVWNALNDPTSSGITDSAKALTYNTPNSAK